MRINSVMNVNMAYNKSFSGNVTKQLPKMTQNSVPKKELAIGLGAMITALFSKFTSKSVEKTNDIQQDLSNNFKIQPRSEEPFDEYDLLHEIEPIKQKKLEMPDDEFGLV